MNAISRSALYCQRETAFVKNRDDPGTNLLRRSRSSTATEKDKDAVFLYCNDFGLEPKIDECLLLRRQYTTTDGILHKPRSWERN